MRAIGVNYDAEQRQQYAKRQAEKYGRLAEYSLDEENQKKYAERQTQWKQQYVKGEDAPESLKTVVEGAIEKTGGKLKQPVAKVPDSGIIKSKIANEEISVTEIQNLGKINTKVLEKEFGKIQTDEIIVTNERIDHIKERHPEDYDLFEKYGRESVSAPDLIIKDIKNKGTVFMVKKLPETNLNVVVRVVLETDDSKLKNSVMTFYRIRERNLKKLIEKNGMLYKKE